MLKVNHVELSKIIKGYYESKLALFVYGAFGIGKSFCVRDTSEEIGKDKKRKFVEWNKLTRAEKQEVYDNPKKYFVLIDERLSEYDSSDIKGLPNFKEGTETIDWKIPLWAKFLTLEGSDGVVFFDEINLATPLVISSVYKIIYDRVVDDSKINDNWLIMGAGNREQDHAFTHTLPAPVRDRGGEVELIGANIDDFSVWATQHGIDSRIIGFINFKPSVLQNVNFKDGQKYTTPRGWERVSKLIKGKKMDDNFKLLCNSAIGEGISREFIAFCEIQAKLNLEGIIKNPEKIKNVNEISIKYFLVSAFAEKYKDGKIDFDKIMEASKVLDEIGNAEYVALLWRLCSSYTKSTRKFKKDFLESKEDSFINKYGGYLI